MGERYEIPPMAEYTEKTPEVPEIQTARKSEAVEALEILLAGSEGAGPAKKTKPSLKQRALAFKRLMEETEVRNGTASTYASDRESEK